MPRNVIQGFNDMYKAGLPPDVKWTPQLDRAVRKRYGTSGYTPNFQAYTKDYEKRRKKVGDKRTAPVEPYRINKDQKEFQKVFRQHQIIKRMLEMRAAGAIQEMKTIQDLQRQLMLSFDGLRQSAPAEPLKETEGMDFQSERSLPPERGMLQY